MNTKLALLCLGLLILAGCGGQAVSVTTTPSATPPPTVDVIGTGQALLDVDQAALHDAQTEVATTQIAQASQEAALQDQARDPGRN